MKMRVIERIPGHPIIEIIQQDANFDKWPASVEVRFFAWDEGYRKVLKPTIIPNVHFGEQTPASIDEWGNIFRAASLLAEKNAHVMFVAPGCDAEILKAWKAVEDAQVIAPAPDGGA